MGHETVLFKSEEKKTKSEIADVLRLLADKVAQGCMTLNNQEMTVDLDLPETMTLEIKVEEETKQKTKRSLEIELEWIVGANEQGSMVIV
ncbi:MAG: hypothetical protein AMJ60_10835 [Desulfobacterales bacterium SG8_35]|jgi:amphi-Trp domain-containing protein|nr:MAG: hypothetical protein AMJ60_10835 [Desulfobacterales bacterium SG8_35]